MNWIKIDVTLPKLETEVLLSWKGSYHEVGELYNDENGFGYWEVAGREKPIDAFTHWMPIPKIEE